MTKFPRAENVNTLGSPNSKGFKVKETLARIKQQFKLWDRHRNVLYLVVSIDSFKFRYAQLRILSVQIVKGKENVLRVEESLQFRQ
jgi:hypothetical protein